MYDQSTRGVIQPLSHVGPPRCGTSYEYCVARALGLLRMGRVLEEQESSDREQLA